MVDSPNKTEIDVESEKLNYLDQTLDNTDNVEQENTSDKNVTNLDNTIQEERTTQENESSEVVNCLALTVKKDYSLSIVKNVVVKTFKNIWRIAISIFTLNFIKFFF